MTDKVNVSVEPKLLAINAGESTQATITLKNTGQTVDQFTVSVEGLQPGWFSLPVSSVALFPNDQDALKIILNPPKEDVKGGSYPFKIKVSSQENSNAPVVLDLSVQIAALPEIGLELLPPVATGRKAHYHLQITNPGTAEAALDLKNTSNDSRLKLEPASKNIKVPPSGRIEAEIDANLHWLTWFFGKKESVFQVTATMPGVADARSVSGTVLRLPWYRALNIRLPWLTKPPQILSFKATTDDNREFRLNWSVKRSTRVTLDEEDVAKQGDRAVRPTEARSYVLTATNKHGSVNRQVDVQPVTVPQARSCERIKISLSQNQIKADAGGVPVPITLQLQNAGQIVDKFMVDIVGIDQLWYTRSASSIALMPQQTGQVQIMFQPPKQKPVRNGVYPFAVAVKSQANPDESTIVLGQLEILPLVEFKAAVRPYRVTTHGKGNFILNLTNTGVTEVNFDLSATDLDEGLKFNFKNESPVVPAWSTLEVPVRVKPKRGSFIGEKKRYDVTMTARCSDKSQTANCELNHAPWLASWRPIWRILRILIALAILVVAVYFVLRAGGGLSTLIDSPSTWVDNFVATIEGWFNR